MWRPRLPELAVLLLLSAAARSAATDEPSFRAHDLPQVFLDCRANCFVDFLRTEITFVDYVRDGADADVLLLITTQSTGSGGKEYTLGLIGRRRFEKVDETLHYVSGKDEPEERARQGLAQVLKLGLMRYIAKTGMAPYISISSSEPPAARAAHDPWNAWVLSVRGEGEVEGQESTREQWIRLALSADRVTPELKISIGLSARHQEERFDVDGVEIVSTRQDRDGSGLAVKSLGPHWSAGLEGGIWRKTFENTSRAMRLGPAVEYSVFRYDESTRRQLRLAYVLEARDVTYVEETVFGRTHEQVVRGEISARLERREPWGSVEGVVELSHYLQDIAKHRLNVEAEGSVRVVQGLSLNMHGRVTRVRDRLSLPLRDATPEEVLLKQRQLATGYEYSAWLGITYTFGSMYNNVVNPRFGN
jgi:hypothetical protein